MTDKETYLGDEEIEFLEANELPRQRWLYSSNARSIIDAMVERGLMQPASGEFGPALDKEEKITLFGREIPVLELTSLYTLTPFGKTILRARKARIGNEL